MLLRTNLLRRNTSQLMKEMAHQKEVPRDSEADLSTTMTVIKRSKVPQYLHQSELYLSLNNDEHDDEISVPSKCMKTDLELNDVDDLEHLLLTMRFWITNTLPEEAITFMSQGLIANTLLQRHQQEYPNLHLLVEDLCTCEPGSQCKAACKYGRLDFLDYFVRHGRPLALDALEEAANYGQLECLKYVYNKLECEKKERTDWKGVNVQQAARAGHLECLRYLIERGLPRSEEMMTSAAKGNQVSTLKYIIAPFQDQFCHWSISMVHGPAVSSSSIECVEYLLETFPTLIGYDNIAREACQTENIVMMKYALERDSTSLARVVISAARAGSMKCLLYLQDEWNADCWIPSTVTEAANYGQCELVLELLQRGCPCDRDNMIYFIDGFLAIKPIVSRESDSYMQQYIQGKVEALKQARVILVSL